MSQIYYYKTPTSNLCQIIKDLFEYITGNDKITLCPLCHITPDFICLEPIESYSHNWTIKLNCNSCNTFWFLCKSCNKDKQINNEITHRRNKNSMRCWGWYFQSEVEKGTKTYIFGGRPNWRHLRQLMQVMPLRQLMQCMHWMQFGQFVQ